MKRTLSLPRDSGPPHPLLLPRPASLPPTLLIPLFAHLFRGALLSRVGIRIEAASPPAGWGDENAQVVPGTDRTSCDRKARPPRLSTARSLPILLSVSSRATFLLDFSLPPPSFFTCQQFWTASPRGRGWRGRKKRKRRRRRRGEEKKARGRWRGDVCKSERSAPSLAGSSPLSHRLCNYETEPAGTVDPPAPEPVPP